MISSRKTICTGNSSSGQSEKEDRQHGEARDGDVDREDEGDGLLDVVENAPPQPHRRHDGREVVVEQDQGCRLARDVRAAATHGDADVGGLERRSVVDAVAGHGDDLPICLQRHYDAQLLLGYDAGKYLHLLDLLRQVPRRTYARARDR